MRNVPVVLVAVVLGGCGGPGYRPVNLEAPAPATAAQTLACVREQMEDMDYQVTDTDPVAGRITGVQVNQVPWYLKWVGYRNTADNITASVEGGQLRVTALSTDPTNPAEGGMATTGATEAAERDAQEILESCSRAP